MDVSEVLGKTFVSVVINDDKDNITFRDTDGVVYLMNHGQDCCESVMIEDIEGDLNDLVGNPILQAEESTNSDNPPPHADSFTWTFYKFTTVKGYVTIRWLGESNGYYGESVDFYDQSKGRYS